MNGEFLYKKGNKYFLTDKAKELANTDISCTELAKIFDTSRNTVSRLLKEENIFKDNRKYHFNEDYFSIIDTPDKAYWLGFLSADGSISDDNLKHRYCIEIGLQDSDSEHLEKFLKYIDSNASVSHRVASDKIHKTARISVNSKKMVKDLINLGCIPNKSLVLTPPNYNQVPEDLIKYWILGYYDGDGGISSYFDGSLRYITYFTGTYEVISFINNFFNFNNSIVKEHNCTNNTYKVEYKKEKTQNMLDYLYDDNSVNFCLERKYLIYLEL